MNATMPFDFTICPLNGEPFKIDATDLVTVKDLKSVLQERYQGDSVSRKGLQHPPVAGYRYIVLLRVSEAQSEQISAHS